MPKPITVLVAGATGHQGGAVARLLLEKGHEVRALTRKPQSMEAEDLRSLGAEVRAADLEDGISVERAARGADAFFLMGTPFERGPEAELRAGRWSAFAAQEAGVNHIVYSSIAGTDWVTGVPSVDSKRQVELYIQERGIPFTIIAPTFFMENLLESPYVDSLRAGRLALPLPATRKLQMTALADIASVVRMAMERPSELVGKRIEVASDELTGPEIASVLAHVTGASIAFEQTPLDEVRAESPALASMWEWLDRGAFDVEVEALRRDCPEIGFHTLGSWLREQDTSVLAAAHPEQPAAI